MRNSRSEIMKAAHKRARQFADTQIKGDYAKCLRWAMQGAFAADKAVKVTANGEYTSLLYRSYFEQTETQNETVDCEVNLDFSVDSMN